MYKWGCFKMNIFNNSINGVETQVSSVDLGMGQYLQYITIPLGDEQPFSSLTYSQFETESALLLSETAHLELCNGRIGQYPSLGIVCSDF